MRQRRSQDFDWRWLVIGGVVSYYLYLYRLKPQGILGFRSKSVIEDFKAKVGPIADIVEAETGIKAALGITQSALESSYGASALSKTTAVLPIYVGSGVVRKGPAYNIFGMKANRGWIDSGKPYVKILTTDYDGQGQPVRGLAAFRAYSSWEESYRDWGRLMQTAAYVADGTFAALTSGDMAAFGTALAKRYAPNQNYDRRLAARAREMGTLA